MNISFQEQCGCLFSGQTEGQGQACGHQPPAPTLLLAVCLQKRYHVFQRGTCGFQGSLALAVLSQKDCHSSENHSLPGLGMEQPAMISWPERGASDATGTEQEVAPFPAKRSRRRQEGPIFPCAPPLSPCSRPGDAAGQQVGVSGLAPTSCLCSQVGLAGAVPDTQPPRREGVNRSGSRQGSRERAGLGLCPTTAPSGRVLGAPRQGWDGGGRPGRGVPTGTRVPAGRWARPWFDKEPRMLPLPLFASGAEVGLFFGGWEVLMC